MNQSSFQSSESANFLNDSSLNDSSIIHPNVQSGQNRGMEKKGSPSQEISLWPQLLEKYPRLMSETTKILRQRSSNSELRQLSTEYQQIVERLNSSRVIKQTRMKEEGEQKEKEQDVFDKLERIQREIVSINEKNDQQADQLLGLDEEKQSNRLRHQLLVKIIKDAVENKHDSPFNGVDSQYHGLIQRLVGQYTGVESRLGMASEEESSLRDRSLQQIQESRRCRIKMQTQKIKEQGRIIDRLISKQQAMMETINEEIHSTQTQQENVQKQINFQQNQQVRANKSIIRQLVLDYIDKNSEEDKLSESVGKPIEEYLQQLSEVKRRKTTLEQELQLRLLSNNQKQNKYILLSKRLSQLQNENRLYIRSLNKQSVENPQPFQNRYLNNEEKILKTYELENVKIKNQLLEKQSKLRSKEVDMFLDRQEKQTYHDQGYQSVIVKTGSTSSSDGFGLKDIFNLKKNESRLNLILIIWVIILVFLFSHSLLPHFHYFSDSEPVKAPRTVVHRYQGKNRLVDGEEVNITVYNNQEKEKIDSNQQQQREPEVIVIEQVSQDPRKSWVEMLKMEYV